MRGFGTPRAAELASCMSTWNSVATVLVVAVLAAVPLAHAQSARSLVKDGNEAYERERYGEAMNSYQAAADELPESAEIWFNKGDALFQQGQYEEAMRAYEQAAVLSDDRKLSAWSKYNQGNAAFRQAMESAQTNPQAAIKGLEESVQLYQDALRASDTLDDSRHNIEVARRAIERLRLLDQQQQQSDQDQEQNEQDQKENQQQQQQPGGEQQEDQSEQNQQGQQEQQEEQQEQQQAQGQEEEQEEAQQAGEEAADILEEERENRRQRRLQQAAGSRAVEKDW